jgi:hypothetical protein
MTERPSPVVFGPFKRGALKYLRAGVAFDNFTISHPDRVTYSAGDQRYRAIRAATISENVIDRWINSPLLNSCELEILVR